jgi:hypothetical protein
VDCPAVELEDSHPSTEEMPRAGAAIVEVHTNSRTAEFEV